MSDELMVVFSGDDDPPIKHEPSSSVMRQKTYVGNTNSNGNTGHEYTESLADAFQNNGDINESYNDNNGYNINDDNDDDMDHMDQLTKNESQSNVHSLLDYDSNNAKLRKAAKNAPNFSKTQSVEPAKLQSNIKRQNSKKQKSLKKLIEIENNNDTPNVVDAFGNPILTEGDELETFAKPDIDNNDKQYKSAKFALPLEQVTSTGTVITHNINDGNDDDNGYASFDENEQLLTNDGNSNNANNMTPMVTNEFKDESKENVGIKPLESSKRRRNSKKFPKTPKNQINGFGKKPNFNSNIHKPPDKPLTAEQRFLKKKHSNPCSMMPCFNFLN